MRFTGKVDIYLINKNGEIVTHVTKHNRLSEAFGRWLLNGNLGTSDGIEILGRNPISKTLYSAGYLRPINTIRNAQGLDTDKAYDSNLAAGYQLTDATCSGSFGLYVLNQAITPTSSSIFPPYFDSTLQHMNKAIISFYGDQNTIDDGQYHMERNNALSRWSMVGTSPSFTVSYHKTHGSAIIRSLVIGALPSSTPSCIHIKQSPTDMPIYWDTAWQPTWDRISTSNISYTPIVLEQPNGSTVTDGITTNIWETLGTSINIIPSASNPTYVISPYLRTAMVNNMWCDGLYTIGTDSEYISFYDLGVHGVVHSDTLNTNTINGYTDDRFCNKTETFINPNVSGGFDIGGGRVLRLNKGEALYDTDGNCIGRTMYLYTQMALSQTRPTPITPDVFKYAIPVYATENTKIPDAIYNTNAPIMVSKRGSEAINDILEFFITMGVGTFTAYTDEKGYHPGGTGIEIHKFSILTYYFRWSTSPPSQIIDEEPTRLVDHGRVAVLPYAIGYPTESSDKPSTNITGNEYISGNYNEAYDYYTLPFTHMLKDCTPLDWQGNETILTSSYSETFVPGVVLDGPDMSFMGDTLMKYNGAITKYLNTNEGYVPLEINQTQWWSVVNSMILSSLTLDTPIVKEEDQRLVINYTYAFDLSLPIPVVPTLTVSIVDDRLLLTLNSTTNDLVLVHRSLDPQFSTFTAVNIDTGTTIREAATAGVHYYYRARSWNGESFSSYTYADGMI